MEKSLEAVKTLEDSAKLPFFARAPFASAATWSPDPKAPPLYLDLLIKDGVLSRMCLSSGPRTRPLGSVDQHIAGLRRYRATSIDVGDQDGLCTDTARLHDLDKYGIANNFEIYSGTHTSAVAHRFQNHVMDSSPAISASRRVVLEHFL
jgi:hypothetical protein